MPHLTFHGLRHALANIALKAGINAKISSEASSHSKVGITIDLYQHVLANMQRDGALLLAMVLLLGRTAQDPLGRRKVGPVAGLIAFSASGCSVATSCPAR